MAIISTVTVMNALDAGLSTVLQPAFASNVMNSSILLDGLGLATTLLLFGAVYAVATLCPAAFRVWRRMDDGRIPAATRTPVAV